MALTWIRGTGLQSFPGNERAYAEVVVAADQEHAKIHVRVVFWQALQIMPIGAEG